MPVRILFYLSIILLGSRFAFSSGVTNALGFAGITAFSAAVMTALAAAVAVGAAWWMAFNFLEDYSGRAELATQVVGGLVNPDSHGQPQLPVTRSVGRGRFSLMDLYRNPNFKLVQSFIQVIGAPCRFIFNLATAQLL